jgi:hypothetical protein
MAAKSTAHASCPSIETAPVEKRCASGEVSAAVKQRISAEPITSPKRPTPSKTSEKADSETESE